jgi:ribonuclease D
MKKIYSRFDKQSIPKLPQVLFEGRIETIVSEQEAEKAVDYLLSQDIIGFDTETKPNFKAGRLNDVALLQVSSRDICFLFRLNHIGMPDCVLRLLTDNSNIKVGLSWHDDIRMLQRRASFTPGTFVELQELVREYGIKDLSLQKLYANIFGQKISKSQRLSNWEADILSEPQKQYAATDAWACIMLYEELLRLNKEGFDLEVVPEPEPAAPAPKEDKPKEKKTSEKAKAKKGTKPKRYYKSKRRTSPSSDKKASTKVE